MKPLQNPRGGPVCDNTGKPRTTTKVSSVSRMTCDEVFCHSVFSLVPSQLDSSVLVLVCGSLPKSLDKVRHSMFHAIWNKDTVVECSDETSSEWMSAGQETWLTEALSGLLLGHSK